MPDNLEQQIQDIMGGFQMEPADGVWTNVQAAIQPERKKRRLMAWWWLGGILLLGAGAGAWWLTGAGKFTHQPAVTTVSHANTGAPVQTAAVTKEQQQTTTQPAGKTPDNNNATLANNEIINPAAAKNSAAPASNNIKNAVAGQPQQRGHTGNAPYTSTNTALFNRASPSTNRTNAEPPTVVPNGALSYNAQTTTAADTNTAASLQLYAVSTEPAPLNNDVYRAVSGQANPFQPLSIPHDPVAIQSPLRHSKWRILPFAGIGVAAKAPHKTAQAFSQNSASAPISNSNGTGFYDNLNGSGTNSGSNGSGGIIVNQSEAYTKAGISWMAGASLEKQLGTEWSFETGLYYHFTAYHAYYQIGYYAAQQIQSTEQQQHYRLHTLGIPVILHVQGKPGIGIGIVNEFNLVARAQVYLSASHQSQSFSINSRVYGYIPSAWFSLDIPVRTSHLQWRLSPYVQYGLGKTFQLSAGAGTQTLIQAGLRLNLK